MDEFQLPSVVGKITRMFVCLNESREQKKAIFLFQALHAVVYVLCCGVFFFFFFCQFRVVFFLNYSGIVTNQMYSVSLLLAISDFHTWISGNGENTEPMKFWTCFNILKMHCHSHILLKEKKKGLLSRLSQVASRHLMLLLDTERQRNVAPGVASQSPATPTCFYRLFFSISVLQTVQTLVEYS